MADEGNPTLRSMSIGRIRGLMKLELRGDPELEHRYKQWVDRYEDSKKTFNSSYRGCDEHNGPGRIRVLD